MGWFETVWNLVRSLRGGSTSADPQLQGQAAAMLEGIDAHVIKTLSGVTHLVEFDPRSERLLTLQGGAVANGKPWFRTALWDRTTDRTLVERDLGNGVVAFRTNGTPLQASWVRDDPARLRLYDVAAGTELRTFRSPLEGPSAFRPITLSRIGSYLAAVAFPARRQGERLDVDPEAATTIAVWDATSGQQVRTLEHKATQDVGLSPDGRLLAAWDIDGEITVWTVPDGKERSRFRVGRSRVFCLAFGRDPVWHEDGSVPPWSLAVGESSGLITIWDLQASRPRSICRGSSYEVRALDFSADGAMLLSAGRNEAKLWDAATGTCLLDLVKGNIFHGVTFAPDGQHLVVSRGAEFDETAGVDLLELKFGRGIRTLYGLTGIVEKTMFSRDGRLVAGISHEWQVGIWEWPSGRLLGVLPVPVGRFADNFGMAFDADGRRFACSVGHEARLWDLETGRTIGHWRLPEGLSDSLAFPSRDRLLLIRQETKSSRGGPNSSSNPLDDPRTVRLYDLLSQNPTKAFREITDFGSDTRGMKVAPDGSCFVVDGTGLAEGKPVRRFHVYEGPTGKLLRDLPTQLISEAPVYTQFDPSGKVLGVLLSRSEPQRYSLFDLPTVRSRGTIDAGGLRCLSPGAARRLAVQGATDNEPMQHVFYDREGMQPFLRIARDVASPGTECSCFSPNGRYVTAGNGDGTITIYDLVEVNVHLSNLRLGW